MFQRFHAMKERREGGFTLIELLVVILIIAILAAIAIPVFLNQRKKAWASQAQSALKNMATAQETYLVDAGYYSNTLAGLTANGFRYTATEVDPFVIGPTGAVNASRYCLKVVSKHDAGIVWYYDSDVGAPSTTACPTFV